MKEKETISKLLDSAKHYIKKKQFYEAAMLCQKAKAQLILKEMPYAELLTNELRKIIQKI